MLYPLSYEGNVRFRWSDPTSPLHWVWCPAMPCPQRAQSIDEQRFLEPLLMLGDVEAPHRGPAGHRPVQ